MRTADSMRASLYAPVLIVAIASLVAAEDCNRNGVPDDRDVLPANFGFARGGSIFTSDSLGSLAAGDVDGDGLDDLAATVGFEVQVHLPLPGAGFREPVRSSDVGNPRSVAVADLDALGRPELVVLSSSGPSVVVLAMRERGGEPILERVSSVVVPQAAYTVNVADFDGDGDLDLAVGAGGGPPLYETRLYRNVGLAFELSASSGIGPSLKLVGSMDANGDGKADLVAIDEWRDFRLSVIQNEGSGTFLPVSVDAVSASAAVPGDFDGDGDQDLAAAGRGITLLISDPATRSFHVSERLEGVTSRDLLVSDVDGDGDLDLGVREETRVSIYLNSGDGAFAAPLSAGGHDLTRRDLSLVAGDFDGDQDVDLAVGRHIQPGGGRVLILENRPVPLSLDCNRDGVPDECAPGLAPACDDCNRDGTSDREEIQGGAADVNANGVPDACEGEFDLRLRFRAPGLVRGSADTAVRVPASVETRTLGLGADEPGPMGWFLRISADGGRLAGATTEDTLAGPPPAGLWNGGFSRIDLPGETRCGEGVLECAVVLSLFEPYVSLPQRSSEILRLEVEVTPAREDGTCSLDFQRDCYRPASADGAGADQPIGIVVTWKGDSRDASFDAMSPMRVLALEFVRGDVNSDSKVDISDAIRGFMYLFLGASAPLCLDANDANDDGQVDITDGIHILSDFFIEGTAIPAPGPFECGLDPTADRVSCGAYAFCE